MANGVNIRPAIPMESGRLTNIAFRSKAHWGYTPEFMASCRAELSVSEEDIENQRHHYYVAESNSVVVGFYVVAPICASEYELDAMFIEPLSIGKGIGGMLIDHAKWFVQSLGATSLLIQSDPNAAGFYLAAGGELVGTRESESIPGRYLPEIRIDLQA